MTKTPRQLAHHVVADVYPEETSPHFTGAVGAAASCWVRPDTIADSLEATVAAKIASDGWRVVELLQQGRVTPQTYADKPQEKRLLEQCLRDGFAADFHVRRREVIARTEAAAAEFTVDELRRFIASLRQGQAFSLLSDADGQWANGVTPDGDAFLPLWSTAAWASRWIEHWPGYRTSPIESAELRESFLETIHRSEMWVGAGVREDSLVTVHAIAVRDLVVA